MDIDRCLEPHWKVHVEAVVLLKITTELSVLPGSFNEDWKNLKGLPLADPDYGIPGYINVLLGIDIVRYI